jgi:hypothetical protein
LIFEVLEEGLLFQRAFVEFREGVTRADDQIKPVARQVEDEHQQDCDGLQNWVATALPDVPVGPEDDGYGNGQPVEDGDDYDVFQRRFPRASGP